jgi:hypothetical protein
MAKHIHKWRRPTGRLVQYMGWRCTKGVCGAKAKWHCDCGEGRCAKHATKPRKAEPPTVGRWSIDGTFALCFDGAKIFYLSSATEVSGIPTATKLCDALNAAHVVLKKARQR